MRRMAILLVLLALAALAPASTVAAAPAGPETNPVGTLRWLPDNTNEAPPAGLHRLVVIYDRSLNAAGKPAELLTKGAFGLKIATTTPDLRMKGHSAGVGSIEDAGGPAEIDEVFMGVEGDIRDGACSRVGTSGFSAAFTSTRTFVHQGTEPYEPQSGPGACEVVDSSVAVSGGFQTRVTTHVPGFSPLCVLGGGRPPAQGREGEPQDERQRRPCALRVEAGPRSGDGRRTGHHQRNGRASHGISPLEWVHRVVTSPPPGRIPASGSRKNTDTPLFVTSEAILATRGVLGPELTAALLGGPTRFGGASCTVS